MVLKHENLKLKCRLFSRFGVAADKRDLAGKIRFEAYRVVIFILWSEARLKSNQRDKIRQVWTNLPTRGQVCETVSNQKSMFFR